MLYRGSSSIALGKYLDYFNKRFRRTGGETDRRRDGRAERRTDAFESYNREAVLTIKYINILSKPLGLEKILYYKLIIYLEF